MGAAAFWCVQCTIHKNLHFLSSISRFVSTAGHVAPEVIFESPIASSAGVYWKALGTLVLPAAGRGVVQVAAHGRRCVLVCAVHHPQKPALPEFAITRMFCFDSWLCRKLDNSTKRELLGAIFFGDSITWG